MIYITLQRIVIDLEVLVSSFQLMTLWFDLMFSKVDSIYLFGLASSIVSLFFASGLLWTHVISFFL